MESRHKGIEGCSYDEISDYEGFKNVKLPLAYQAFLMSMGKTMLFEFMNAENMAFEDLDDIRAFGAELLSENNITIERPFLIISERRNEFITLLYLDEGDNPPTWIYSDDNENKLQIRTQSFTDLIMSFITTLIHFPHTFNFVSGEDEMERKQKFNSLHKKYEDGLMCIYEAIKKQDTKNELTLELNSHFKDYISDYLEIKEEPEPTAEDLSTTEPNTDSLEKEKKLALEKYEQLKRAAKEREVSNNEEKGNALSRLLKRIIRR